MKEQLILWISSAIITFLVLYLGNVSGKYYPVSGTIGINGQKVTYKFDKLLRSNTGYNVIIRKDINGADAFLLWRRKGDPEFNRIKMRDSGEVFTGTLPSQPPYTHIQYKSTIISGSKSFPLPSNNSTVDIVILGNVPPAIMNLYYFFLFGGIMLSIRGALEYFNGNKKVKVYTIFSAIFFFCFTIAVTPLKSSYELGAISHSVPGIEQLFNMQSILLFITWMVGMVIIVSSKKPGIRGLIFAAITILIYLLVPVAY